MLSQGLTENQKQLQLAREHTSELVAKLLAAIFRKNEPRPR